MTPEQLVVGRVRVRRSTGRARDHGAGDAAAEQGAAT
jgi:hypothetical protein